jgi:hypothetical protein
LSGNGESIGSWQPRIVEVSCKWIVTESGELLETLFIKRILGILSRLSSSATHVPRNSWSIDRNIETRVSKIPDF